MQLAFWLRGLMELCIYPPQPGMHRRQTDSFAYPYTCVFSIALPDILSRRCRAVCCKVPLSEDSIYSGHRAHAHAGRTEELPGGAKQLPLSWSCTESALMHLISARDPSGKGLPSVLALRLLMLLLHWNPAMRPTTEQVLPDCVHDRVAESAMNSLESHTCSAQVEEMAD